ncbi:MAG: hypothetical protein HY391_05345 [Deltaproteobacteria bacterium]|nr:hypothetical protein [Deltaproteobacteria bacterium]
MKVSKIAICFGIFLISVGCGQEKTALQMGEDFLAEGDLWNARAAFRQVVKEDTYNVRGNFYLAFLEPVVIITGYDSPLRTPFFKLVEALKAEGGLASQPAVSSQHAFVSLLAKFLPLQYLRYIAYSPRPGVIELRSFTKEKLIPAIDQGIAHAKVLFENKDLRHTLDASKWGWPGLVTDHPEMDWGDAMLLKSALYSMRAMAEVILAYNLTDLFEIAEKLDKSPDKSPMKIVALIKSYPNFATKQESDHLVQAKGHLATSLDALRDAISSIVREDDEQANDLLPKDKLPVKFEETVQTLRESLEAEKEVKWYVKAESEKEPIEILLRLDLSKFFGSGSDDLKGWLPQFDTAGRLTSYPDLTFGGISPQGDLVALFCSGMQSREWCP